MRPQAPETLRAAGAGTVIFRYSRESRPRPRIHTSCRGSKSVRTRIALLYLHLLGAAAASALTPPYLKSVAAVSPSRIEIAWRNNDLDAKGFVILRRGPGDAGFRALADVAAPAESYADTAVEPDSWYRYAVLATVPGAHSDWSAIDSAKTPAIPKILVNPDLYADYDSTIRCIRIRLVDLSNAEQGYRIYRALEAGPKTLWKDVPSASPSRTGTLEFADSAARPNAWYTYWAELVSDGGAYSDSVKIFTFDVARWLDAAAPALRLGSLVSRTKAAYDRWALMHGDSLIFHEKGDGDSVYSVLDLKDRTQPKFLGYGRASRNICPDSVCITVGNRVVMRSISGDWSGIWMGAFNGSGFLPLDSLAGYTGKFYKEPLLGDSVFLMELWKGDASFVERPVQVGPSRLFASDGFDVFTGGGYRAHRLRSDVRSGFFLILTAFIGPTTEEHWDHLFDFRHDWSHPDSMTAYRTSHRNQSVSGVGMDPALLPRTIGGMAYGDSILLGAQKLVLDTARRQVLAFIGDELRIYGYSVEAWGNPATVLHRPEGRSSGGNGNRFGWEFRAGSAAFLFRYSAPEPTHADLLLTDAKGRVLANPVSGPIGAGSHAWAWDRFRTQGPVLVWFRAGNYRFSGRL